MDIIQPWVLLLSVAVGSGKLQTQRQYFPTHAACETRLHEWEKAIGQWQNHSHDIEMDAVASCHLTSEVTWLATPELAKGEIAIS